MANFLGFGSLRNLIRNIKHIGGPKKAILNVIRTDDLKFGKLVGQDKYGNKYYENDGFFYGRNRWIIYADQYGYDYDASQVPAEWYGWLHYKTDLIPSEVSFESNGIWCLSDIDNCEVNFVLGLNLYPYPFPTFLKVLKIQFEEFVITMKLQDPTRPKHKWMSDHMENYSGTEKQYVPYSTTRSKIEAWTPPKGKKP